MSSIKIGEFSGRNFLSECRISNFSKISKCSKFISIKDSEITGSEISKKGILERLFLKKINGCDFDDFGDLNLIRT